MSAAKHLEAALEAVLFVTAEPVSIERLLAVFDASQREEALVALAALRERYRPAEGRGVLLEEVAGGLRIVTAPENHPYLKRFFDAAGANRLSMAALETLAIVAYRQPVTGPEVQELRGKNPSAALKTLLERRLVRITGRKEVVGRPFLYATTREFLVHFGLKSLDELPPLEEFAEAFGGPESDEPRGGIARDHATIGLVSAAEAEAVLATEEFAARPQVSPAVAPGDEASVTAGGEPGPAPPAGRGE